MVIALMMLGTALVSVRGQDVDSGSVAETAESPADDQATTVVPESSDSIEDSPSLADRHDLAAFLDGIMASQMANTHFAGATLSVVVGDQVAFSKGYGLADVENEVSVDAATTMFRIGSISKLFVWTAIMQLVEDGKIDLDQDVNAYLADAGFDVPAAFDKPITINDLMAHTPGFEDHVVGLFAKDHDAIKPIVDVMRSQMPRRVMPPGDLASYSNHGSLLAAVIVERVSGMPWEAFVKQRILIPLEMRNTLLEQPPQDQLPKNLSPGFNYDAAANKYQKADFEYIPVAPAGCIGSSADDMARFMIAHLNSGQLKGEQILKPETVAQMHSRSRWHDQRLDAMCHGFWERHRNGVRILEHGGDTNLFHSALAILPDEKVGLFVSYNTATATQTREQLLDAFLDRYFPFKSPKLDPPQDFTERGKRFAGSYKLLRYDHSTFAKLMMIVQVVPVAVRNDNRLSIAGKPFIEVEPLMFQQENGQDKIAFREDDAGEITHLFMNRLPAIGMQKMKWYESQYLHGGLLAASTLLFASTILGWPLVHLITKGEVLDGELPTKTSRSVSWFGWLAAIGFVAYFVAFAIQANEIVNGMPPVLEAMLRFSPLLGVVAIILLLLAALAWVRRYWRLTGRIHFLLLALAAVGFTWQLAFFNLVQLGW